MGVNREELRDRVNAALKKRAVTSLTADRGKRITEGLSSGSLMLNVALSGNPLVGYVWGRIVEIYGPESCLDAQTFIRYEVRSRDGKRQNHKGGTIRRLYERFHGLSRSGRGFYQRDLTRDSVFYVPSVNEHGAVFHNQVADVVFTGRKECFLVRSVSGKELVCTADHRFYTGTDYVRLEELSVGDTVCVHDNVRCLGRKEPNRYVEVYVRYHPNGRRKIVTANDRQGHQKYSYIRYRVRKSHLLVEADRNGMTYEEYRNALNSKTSDELESLWVVPDGAVVHHKDGDSRNDVLENLELNGAEEHSRYHANQHQDKLRFVLVEDQIESIETVGYRETYDIKCYAPHNNYIAQGFVVHNSGKTTLALTAIREAQLVEDLTGESVPCLFVDAEHALDTYYAESLGIDIERLDVAPADCGEDALNAAEAAIREGYKLVVVDSVAALTPRAEIEGEMGEAHVGLQARLMSQACRKLSGICAKNKATVIFINQLRLKIGVMFGCFSYDSRVTLADGSVQKIGKIVNNRMEAEVRSFDPITGEVRPAKITGWHKNGQTDEWVRVVAQRFGGNGRTQFKATENHVVFTPGMVERRIGELDAGDELLVQAEYVFNEQQNRIALSQILGDGSVRYTGLTAQLRIGHGPNQSMYARWKATLFGDLVGWDDGESFFDLTPSADLLGVRDTPELISDMGVLGLTLWYLDDGTFSGSFDQWGNGKSVIYVKRWSVEQREKAADLIRDLIGVRPTSTGNGLLFSGERTRVFHEAIAPYVPECMEYKLHPMLRGGTKMEIDSTPNLRYGLIPSKIVSIERVPAEKKRRTRFDIEVEGTHGYLVDGCAVHNSPETTPGGKALAYYSTYRLEVRSPRGGKKEGKTLMGYGQEEKVELATNTNVHVVKNKVFPPHRRTSFVIEYGKGIDRLTDTLAFLEWSGAFQPNEKTKAKSPVIRIPSKGKLYTAKGLREIIEEPEVQEDVLAIIREMAEREDT